jgi:hypothetical protein
MNRDEEIHKVVAELTELMSDLKSTVATLSGTLHQDSPCDQDKQTGAPA